MIEIDRITKTYGDIRAVDSVSMTVETGTITVIVGTSGSGKTTLLRMINRLEEPTSGEVRINGDSTLSVVDWEHEPTSEKIPSAALLVAVD